MGRLRYSSKTPVNVLILKEPVCEGFVLKEPACGAFDTWAKHLLTYWYSRSWHVEASYSRDQCAKCPLTYWYSRERHAEPLILKQTVVAFANTQGTGVWCGSTYSSYLHCLQLELFVLRRIKWSSLKWSAFFAETQAICLVCRFILKCRSPYSSFKKNLNIIFNLVN